MTVAISTVRAWRSPMPRDSSPFANRSRAGLRIASSQVFGRSPALCRSVRSSVGRAVAGSGLLALPAPIPPAAAHRREQLHRVKIALNLGADIADPRLFGEALRIEHLQDADIAIAVGGARQAQR